MLFDWLGARWAVIERNGEVSVLQAGGGRGLDPWLLKGCRGEDGVIIGASGTGPPRPAGHVPA